MVVNGRDLGGKELALRSDLAASKDPVAAATDDNYNGPDMQEWNTNTSTTPEAWQRLLDMPSTKCSAHNPEGVIDKHINKRGLPAHSGYITTPKRIDTDTTVTHDVRVRCIDSCFNSTPLRDGLDPISPLLSPCKIAEWAAGCNSRGAPGRWGRFISQLPDLAIHECSAPATTRPNSARFTGLASR